MLNNATGGTIIATGATAAVTGAGGGGASTVINAGTITGNPTARYVVQLGRGGTVTNSGVITDIGINAEAVRIDQSAGSVANSGSITGGRDGVVLTVGGLVNNGIDGTISGTANAGVYIGGGAGTVTNAGTIAGGVNAVQFAGNFADRLIIDPGAVFQGIIKGGSGTNTLELAKGKTAGALSGLGSQFLGFGTIVEDSGANWTLSGANTLIAAGTFTDSGTLTNTGTVTGAITLAAGGELTNASSGVISTAALGTTAPVAVRSIGNNATVVNAGTIQGAQNAAGAGVLLSNGGTLTNQLGGLIGGFYGVEALTGSNTVPVTVVNAGSITGGDTGIDLDTGGWVSNQASGTITSQFGIYAHHSSTIVNAGSIAGTLDAVLFGTGAANRLVIDPGAVFSGTVDGGNTLGSATASTLELTSAATSGTLTGLGAQFIDFGQVVIDSGAAWTLSGTNKLNAGGTLTDSGTLTNTGSLATTGVTLAAGAMLTNTATGTISAVTSNAIVGAGGSSTVANYGSIGANPTNGSGVFLNAGGLVTNHSTGTITGLYGVRAINAAATVVNAGHIAANTIAGTGVVLNQGGLVTNQAGGAITGYAGVYGTGAPLTVTNAGTISSLKPAGFGIWLNDGGSITNQAGATISGSRAIFAQNGAATVVNAGTVSGDLDAVLLAAGFTNRVVIDPGAVFTSTVDGGNTLGSSIVSTLELTSAASTGTLSGFGTHFVDFGSIVLDDGAKWELDGASPGSGQTIALTGANTLDLGTPGSFTDVITGFDVTDALDLTGLAFTTGATATLSSGTLTVHSNSIVDTFNLSGLAPDTTFAVTDDGLASHGVLVMIDHDGSGKTGLPCYCQGTLILTERGEVAVEALAIGDVVVTASGQHRPVKWIGRRSYAGRFLAANPAAQPIRFNAGSLGDDLPHRTLLVSPEHAMFLDGLLIPARCLVNGCSIVQESGLQRVDYYHVELDSHDVLLAEGAPSESFLNDDSRGMFHNAHEYETLYPKAPLPNGFCSRRVEGGFEVEAIRRRLAVVAEKIARPKMHTHIDPAAGERSPLMRTGTGVRAP